MSTENANAKKTTDTPVKVKKAKRPPFNAAKLEQLNIAHAAFQELSAFEKALNDNKVTFKPVITTTITDENGVETVVDKIMDLNTISSKLSIMVDKKAYMAFKAIKSKVFNPFIKKSKKDLTNKLRKVNK